MKFLIASVQSLLILQILTGSRFREPLAGFSKLLMIVLTLNEADFIKICLTSSLPKLARSSLKWLSEACYTGHLQLTETRQCTCGNRSVCQHKDYEAAFGKICRDSKGLHRSRLKVYLN